MFANIVLPPKLANIPPCYICSPQTIDGTFIFSYSLAKLANMVQDRKVGKHTPPQPWGANIAQSTPEVKCDDAGERPQTIIIVEIYKTLIVFEKQL